MKWRALCACVFGVLRAPGLGHGRGPTCPAGAAADRACGLCAGGAGLDRHDRAEGRIVPALPGASTRNSAGQRLPLFSIRKAGTPPDFFGPRDSFGFSVIDIGAFQFGPALQFVNRAQSVGLHRAQRPRRRRLCGAGGRFRQFLAGAVAAVAWRGSPRHRRRNRRDRRYLPRCGRAVRAVDVVGWTAHDGADRGGDFALFQHHAAQAAAADHHSRPAEADRSTMPAAVSTPTAPGRNCNMLSTDQWAAHAFVEYQRLTDSAANSPLVTQRGSPNQFTYGLGATYSFNMHPWW